MAITLEQFSNRLPSVIRLVNQKIPGFLLVAGKRLEGLQKQRIFNKGQASDGSRIGTYSDPYAALRQRKGLQRSFVDLQFTGQLFENFQVLRDGADVVLAIPAEKNFRKAEANEKRFKKTIFEPTKEEERDVERDFERRIETTVERIILNL